MFARIAAIAALSLLLTIPAAQAAPDAACLVGYRAAPYAGPVGEVAEAAGRVQGCMFATEVDAAPGPVPQPILRVQLVPNVEPLPALETPIACAQVWPWSVACTLPFQVPAVVAELIKA